ncbi:MAG: hypothetical protein GX590_06035 [Lentisphaerae bacterium]|nr:hypothetical protein [Lentisphaerota bacterium]
MTNAPAGYARRLTPLLLAMLLAGAGSAAIAPDATRLAALAAGARDEARADWWGYDATDATPMLQAALTSGVRRLIIPNLGTPWIIHPVKLGSNLRIELEPGTVIEAIRGGFKKPKDALFSAAGQSNIVIHGGAGATLRMHKRDYQDPEQYERGEWRHTLSLLSSENIHVEGLTFRSSGGDGIYIGYDRSVAIPICRNVTIRNCLIDDNHRQGISVIGVSNLLVEGCTIRNTSGTPPQAGIDFEGRPFQEVTVRDCVFENNYAGVIIMTWMTPQSPVNAFTFENCLAVSNRASGFSVTFGSAQPPLHLLRCSMTNTVEITRKGEIRRYDDFWRDLVMLQPLTPAEADQVQRITRWNLEEHPLRPLSDPRPPALPDGAKVPAPQPPGARGPSSWLLHADAGETTAFTAHFRPIGGQAKPMAIRLVAPSGRALPLDPPLVGRQPETYTFKAPEPGLYRIDLDPGNSVGRVAGAMPRQAEPLLSLDEPAPRAKPVAMLAHDRAIHFMSTQSLFYFHVPAGVREFYLLASGSGAERVKVTVYNARSESVAVADDICLARRLFFVRDNPSAGEIWMVRTERPSGYGIEDFALDLFGVPPVLATTVEALVGD